jgi:hypothetical protein
MHSRRSFMALVTETEEGKGRRTRGPEVTLYATLFVAPATHHTNTHTHTHTTPTAYGWKGIYIRCSAILLLLNMRYKHDGG